MRGKVIVRITTFLLLIAFACSSALPVEAAGFGPAPELQQGVGSTIIIKLMYKDDNKKTVMIADANMTLYRVADLEVNHGMAHYALLDEIKVENIDLDTMTPEDSIEYASELADYVSQNNIKGESKRSDEQGKVVFTKMIPGMYLATMDPKTDNSKMITYKMSPFLIMAPTLTWNKRGERVWEYQVTVLPKFALHSESNVCEIETSTPSEATANQTISHSSFYMTPKTGDDTNTTLWCGLLIASIVGIVLLMLPITKRKKQ